MLVREVMGFLEFETNKLGVEVRYRLLPKPILVEVDLVQIEQVLLNLVRNAFDALEERPKGQRRLTLSTHQTADQALVRVEDNAKGIPQDRMKQLFDPFFTTKETGMGMGLPISETILANHGGHISAESQLGEGTTFSMALPLARDEKRPIPGTGNRESRLDALMEEPTALVPQQADKAGVDA